MKCSGEPLDGLVSYPRESCYYPCGFMVRKHWDNFLQGRPLGSSTEFFCYQWQSSNLTGYLKNFLKFCEMLETNLVEKNMETYFRHGHGNLLISLLRRVNKKPKMLGITVLLVYMLTVQTDFICSDAIYAIFLRARFKKNGQLLCLCY